MNSKKLINVIFFSFLIQFMLFVIPSPARAEQVVTIPDINLENAVRIAINKPIGDITDTDMAGLTALDASNRSIVNLTGLEYAVNLTSADLQSNLISDLTPLSNLTQLQTLYININQISDISPLSNLTNLSKLVLSKNNISNLTPLANLTNLTELHLSDNLLSDISVVSNFPLLTKLILYTNQISDLTPLSGLTNLRELGLNSNQITDISPLSNLINLTDLSLRFNQITDITPLANLTQLRNLYLNYNNVHDINSIINMVQLSELNLELNNVSDISVLSNLTGSLTVVDLTGDPLDGLALGIISNIQDAGVDVLYDLTPPFLDVTFPTDNSLVTDSTKLNVMGNAEIESTVRINGNVITPDILGNFTSQVELTPGINIITFTATDFARNTTTVTRTVTRTVNFDNLPPTLVVNSPSNYYSTSNYQITVAGTTEVGSTLRINGVVVNLGGDGSFSRSINLAEGINYITISATDGAGNTSTTGRTVFLDTIGPNLTVSSPIDNFKTNQPILNLSGNTEGGSTLYINGIWAPVLGDGSFNSTLQLVPGKNTINISAFDSNGNSTNFKRDVFYDNVAPVVNVTLEDNLYTNKSTISVKGTVDPTAKLSINGNGVVISGDSFDYEASLVPGNNTITIEAEDDAGNKTTVTRNVIYDNISPNLQVLSPIDKLQTNKAFVIIKGIAEEGSTVKINNKIVTLEGKEFSKTINLAKGSNSITILAIDQSGNTTVIKKTIIYDTVPPTLKLNLSPYVKTKKSSLLLRGTTEEGCTIKINGVKVTVKKGKFSKRITLKRGNNRITVTSNDKAGNTKTTKIMVRRK